ncbi:MAG: TIGR01244 family phosphatase [Burkholderiaceae bacterium]|jgi:uncharacterized protein (TIGR01244 family)|nr:TIGR01244 family phosphatase [Burkholderiaceae bacterium]
MSKLKVFAFSKPAAVLLVLGWLATTRAAATPAASTIPLADNIQVSAQISPEQLTSIKAQGFRTVIDLRPDGEALGQPSSTAMAQAAKQAGLQFSYLPVPRGSHIPSAAADTLARLLAQAPRPILMYCRSGTRAARTWALAEASRPGGLDAASIVQHARAAGRPADDLQGQITQRIAARGHKP